jgi:hypothetical protein
VLDFICEAMDEGADRVHALVINPGDVSLTIKVHRCASKSKEVEQCGKVGLRRGVAMEVLYTLLVAN